MDDETRRREPVTAITLMRMQAGQGSRTTINDTTAGPVRTCLSCRGKKQQKELCRFAISQKGILVLDEHREMAGRGAYACRNTTCIERFLKDIKKLHRAFRRQDLVIPEDLFALFRSG